MLWGPLRLEPAEPWPRGAPPQVTQQRAGPRPRASRIALENRDHKKDEGPRRQAETSFPGAQSLRQPEGGPCAASLRLRQTAAAVTASEVILPGRIFRVQTRRAPAGAGQPTSAQTSGQMTPVCPRPALGYHFFPCLLRSVFKDARSAAPRAEAAGPPRPLSSTRSLSRGCRGASNVGAQTDRTPLAGSGEAGSPAAPPQGRPGWGRRRRRSRRRREMRRPAGGPRASRGGLSGVGA